jgi:DNA-binding GntR family transcriptional regulator
MAKARKSRSEHAVSTARKKPAGKTGRRASTTRKLAPPASAMAYAKLREEIIDCVRSPGERLTESEVAAQMQLGKTPVREALRQLVHEGLVRVHPRRGYIVSPVTLRDVENLCGLRLIVEPAAVALAAGKLDDERAAILERWCRVGYEVTDPDSVHKFHMANRAFHATIAQACGNPRLAALVDQMLVESQRLIQFGMLLQPHSDEAVHSHEALLEAVREGNAAAARRIVAQEIRDTQRMVIDGLLRHSTLRNLAVALPGVRS